MITRIFVYGTLRRGGSNHHLLCDFIPERTLWTPPDFTLIDLGTYPGLLSGGATAVLGEVYRVDAVTLRALDHLEDEGRHYHRRAIALADGSRAEAYLLDPRFAVGRTAIASGDWLEVPRAPYRAT
jgi:gamma-glutamylaminecyclotransferase